MTGPVNRAGIKPPRHAFTDEQKAEMNRLRFVDGWKLKQIADKFGCAQSTVRAITDARK